MQQPSSPSPSPSWQAEIETRIFADRVDILYQHARKALAISSANVAVMTAVLYDVVPHDRLWTWLLVMLTMALFRLATTEIYLRARHGNARRWLRLFIIGSICQGLGWGIMCPLFVFIVPPLYQALLFMVLGGMIAGASVFHSSFFFAYLAYALPAALPVVAFMFVHGQEPVYLAMGVMTSLFLTVILAVVQRTSGILLSNLRLKYENLGLMESTSESESKFRALTENTASAIFILSGNSFKYLNPTVEDYTGYSREVLLQKNFMDLVHPDDHDMVLRNAAARLKNEHDPDLPSRYEFRFLHKSGDICWVDFTPAIMVYKGVRSILGTAFDITSRKRVEQELATSEERYRMIFDTAQDAMFLIEIGENGNDRILDVNTRACESLGYTREELLQCHGYEFDAHPEHGIEDLTQAIFRNGHAVFEREHKARDGHTFPVEISSHYVRLQGCNAILSIVRNIARRKEYEQQLLMARDQAESANRAKSEFLANMNHELRTPLNGVLGMLQLAKLTDLNEEQLEYIDTAMTSGSSLLNIINDILDLSKIEAGRLELMREPFAPRDVLDSVIKVFAVLNREGGPAIRYEIDPSVPDHVVADPGRLRQILFNLVGNAFKFTERGEVVTRVTAAQADEADGLVLRFEVSDTGMGIPADRLSDIFEPFVQAHTELNGKIKGTGLGLTIVKRLVARMGGTVSAESTEGEGTTVRFHILAHTATDHLVGREELSAEEDKDVGACRVLLVEDDAINQLLASRFLEKAGHATTVADTGDEALRLLTESPFDLVLLDIQLPGMSGKEVARRIRSGQSGALDPEIPIIALTAYTLDGDQQRLLAAGMNDCLSKPLEMGRLSSAIRKVMAGRTSC